jgi:hypothetical protein
VKNPLSEANKKRDFIMNHEELFAEKLALKVLERPTLSVWMILVPIIFVYYFYQYQKFVNGKKMFAEHYLISRRRALDEAMSVIDGKKTPDIKRLAGMSDVPDTVREKQEKVLGILVEHFISLLRSEGEDYRALVQSAYQNRTNYLLFLNNLNHAEKDVNMALKPHLQKDHEGVNSVVSSIELQSEMLRREYAEDIFHL